MSSNSVLRGNAGIVRSFVGALGEKMEHGPHLVEKIANVCNKFPVNNFPCVGWHNCNVAFFNGAWVSKLVCEAPEMVKVIAMD